MNRRELLKIKGGSGVYSWLLRNNPSLLNQIFPLTRTKWALESCKQDALKYNTRMEWSKNSGSAHKTALKNKWLEECCSHMTSNRWTLQDCKQDALKYNTRNEWYKNSGSAHKTALKNKWLEECCSHMEPSKTGKKYVRNLDTGEIFESMTNAAKSVGSAAVDISAAIKRNGKCKGYRWAYCDEKGNVVK